jgi:Calx-beta domain
MTKRIVGKGKSWMRAVSSIEALEERRMLNSPVVSIGNANARERGLGSVSYALVPVTLARRASANVRIGFATKAGSATAGVDFTPVSGTLTIPVGQSSGRIRVRIIGDNATEGTEKFYVRLTSAVHATLPTPPPIATVKIVEAVEATPISDNLSAAPVGSQGASVNTVLAASFIAPTNVVTLNQVTLLMSEISSGGGPTVKLYTDDGADEPGSALGSFNAANQITSSMAAVTFVTAGAFGTGVPLTPGAKYWVLLVSNGGGFQWSQSSASGGSGTGFTGEWSASVDGGNHWSTNHFSPLQMKVTG